MKFCSHCGAKLEGDERFCVSCGADTTTSASAPSPSAPLSTQASVPFAVPTTVASVPHPVQVMVQPHTGIADPYALHVPATPMAEVATKHTGVHWTWIILALIIAAGYFYSQGNSPSSPPPAAPATQPAAPGAQPDPAQPGTPAALLQLQSFSGHWQAIYGSVQVTNGVWTNHSNVAIQSGVLECDQYAANGSDLVEMKETLTGPIQPNGNLNFDPFQMGPVNSLMSKVNCGIVSVTPAS